MIVALPPLTAATAVTSWRLDVTTTVLAVVIVVGYWWGRRRSTVPVGRGVVFSVVGVGIWLLTADSALGVYDDELFWVRAAQIVLLLMVVPFGLALGMPLTVVLGSLPAAAGTRFEAALHGHMARFLTHPATMSAALLVLPWLIYLTGWYRALLTHGPVDVLTRLLIVLVGWCYFTSRLHLDPVPRHFSPGLSLIITVVEAIGDGLLGIVLWQGTLVALDHYLALDRMWGPSPRTDQTIGAGVLWVFGDVVGLPFLLTLLRRFTLDDRARAQRVDEQLASAPTSTVDGGEPQGGLWWEQDPQLRDRFRR
ncbi:cytochrome c oxidase assembly protein [Williamsia sterculiae]|uniref:cytochrome c oxidase assembly protein n=1 Tax=Williamsia sterculiae TaxID=1344003 RepID=UPI0009703FEE|nr:cytochrome c oxidase assembly protein [Williamsia sterculiae]